VRVMIYRIGVFPGRMKNVREEMGLSIRETANRIGIHFLSLYRIETGAMNPTIGMLVKIAEFYGVSIDWLCGKDGELHD
jgi:transcriptional regulator with XRE-family HTH domain